MKMQIGVTCLAAGALALLGGSLQAQRSYLSASDRTFMREAAMGGVAEVRLGRLAAERGSSDWVRTFGQRMVDDHSKAGDDLKQVAQNKGISLPNEMSTESRALYRRLSRLHGAAFDHAYMQAMREDHQKDIQAFRNEARNGRDADVRAFADRTLPIVREHYRMISR
jgi:putative membrane protein